VQALWQRCFSSAFDAFCLLVRIDRACARVCTYSLHLPAGEECVDPPCIVCSPCAPGFFKSAVGTDPCTACPVNTYREEPRAQELSNCLSCLTRSSTRGAQAQTTWRACVCDDIYYILQRETAEDSCQKCPPGLICHGDSKVESVVENSTWTPDGPIYRLQV